MTDTGRRTGLPELVKKSLNIISKGFMKKRELFLMLLVCVLASAFPAMAQDRPDRDQWMSEIRQYRRTYFTKELDLSKEQQNKFFPIYDEMEEQINRIDEDARTMERRIADAADASDLEHEKATEAMYDAKVNQAQIERTYMEKFKNVLNKKQLFELKSVEKQFQRDMLKQHQRLRSRRAAENAQ